MAEGDLRDNGGDRSFPDDAREYRIHLGALPPPDVLREYEQQIPGFTERLIRMAELEQEFRLRSERELERRSAAQLRMARVGQLLSLVLLLMGLAMAVFLTTQGFGTAGFALLTALAASHAALRWDRMPPVREHSHSSISRDGEHRD